MHASRLIFVQCFRLNTKILKITIDLFFLPSNFKGKMLKRIFVKKLEQKSKEQQNFPLLFDRFSRMSNFFLYLKDKGLFYVCIFKRYIPFASYIKNEFFFTTTPSVILHLMEQRGKIEISNRIQNTKYKSNVFLL